jgi:transposase
MPVTNSEANQRAKARSEGGLTRELAVARDNHAPNPARGGTGGYPLYLRIQILERAEVVGIREAAEHFNVAVSSLYRWIRRIHPYRMTGGKEREGLVGRDLLLLSIGLTIYPDFKADELASFIVENGGEMYSRQMISQRMKDIGMSIKVASTEAYQAFTPINMRKCLYFWTLPPPLGVVGLLRPMYVDFDECGIALETTNTKYGHAHTSIRIRKPGHYTKSRKVTVIMAIEPGDPTLPANVAGSIVNPRRWISVRDVSGTNAFDFAAFCDDVCTDIETHPANGVMEQRRVFLWDNLASHRAPVVAQTVEGRPSENWFTIVHRPPYQPKFGPIEYVFCELAAQLEKLVQPDWSAEDLMLAIVNVASQLGRDGGFNNTFAHCGY